MKLLFFDVLTCDNIFPAHVNSYKCLKYLTEHITTSCILTILKVDYWSDDPLHSAISSCIHISKFKIENQKHNFQAMAVLYNKMCQAQSSSYFQNNIHHGINATHNYKLMWDTLSMPPIRWHLIETDIGRLMILGQSLFNIAFLVHFAEYFLYHPKVKY